MLSLLDVAPPEVVVTEIDIRGVKLPLRGVRAADWATLYARFPELREIVAGRDGGNMDRLRAIAAESALIAAGTGKTGNADIERAAMTNLTMEERRSLIDEIIKISLPGDVFGPLLDAVEGGAAPATAAQATK
jgi:hypothetical protein